MTPQNPGVKGWGGLGALAILWGGAFAVITVAVDSVPPSLVAFGRLTLAAALLTAWTYYQGRPLPSITDRRWLWFLGLGLFGNALPFTLIAIGQQEVPSGVAGILMGVTPLAIIMAAHFVLPNEKLNRYKLTGFVIGFSGIVMLMGPSALEGLMSTSFIYQALIFGGTLCYATNAIMYQAAPETPPTTVAAGSLICAALLTLPLAVYDLAGGASFNPSWGSLAAVVALGIFPTALATIIYMGIARKVGAAFIAMINYAVPVVAALLGFALGENLGTTAWIALGVILLGIFIARRTPKSR